MPKILRIFKPADFLHVRAGVHTRFCASEPATSGGPETNSYHLILERNLFGLKPAPAPQSVEAPAPPPPKITLTRITTVLGYKQVLMKVQMPVKPTEPAREQSFILTEGQREGDVEVVAVNEKTGDVTLNDFGAILTLNLEKDGSKFSDNSPRLIPPPVGFIPPVSLAAGTPVGHRR